MSIAGRGRRGVFLVTSFRAGVGASRSCGAAAGAPWERLRLCLCRYGKGWRGGGRGRMSAPATLTASAGGLIMQAAEIKAAERFGVWFLAQIRVSLRDFSFKGQRKVNFSTCVRTTSRNLHRSQTNLLADTTFSLRLLISSLMNVPVNCREKYSLKTEFLKLGKITLNASG